MTFTYTYRDRTGAKQEDTLDAASRSAAFAALKTRGITPLSLTEGGKPSRAKRDKPSAVKTVDDKGSAGARFSRKAVIGVIAILVVLLGVGCAWWFMRSGKPAPKQKQTTPKVAHEAKRTHRVARATTNAVPVRQVSQPIATKPAQKEKPALNPTSIVEVISVQTNKSGTVIERFRRADGTTGRAIRPKPSPFKHASDQILALVASTPPGGDMPPMPANPITDAQFLESLKDPIEISADDPDDLKVLKTNVMAMREQVKELMAQGQSVNSILAEHQKLQSENTRVRTEAVLEMKKLIDSGDREGAIRYAKAVNASFEQMGVEAIPVPSKEPAVDRRGKKGKDQ